MNLHLKPLVLYVFLIIFTGTAFNSAQAFKESTYMIMEEAQARAALKEGGKYEGKSRVDKGQYHGFWVQYRKVLRIEKVAADPKTGKSWYHVFYSKLIPGENPGGHDPKLIQNGWLWLSDGMQAPWKKTHGSNPLSGTTWDTHAPFDPKFKKKVPRYDIVFKTNLYKGLIKGVYAGKHGLCGTLNGQTYRFKYYTTTNCSGSVAGEGEFEFNKDFSRIVNGKWISADKSSYGQWTGIKK